MFVVLCLRHVSAVPNVASVSGLSILEFPSVFSNIYFNKGLLLIPGKHLHDDIISVRGEIGARETGLTPLLLIAVPARSHDVERWCMYVLMVSRFPFFNDCSIGYLNYNDKQCGIYSYFWFWFYIYVYPMSYYMLKCSFVLNKTWVSCFKLKSVYRLKWFTVNNNNIYNNELSWFTDNSNMFYGRIKYSNCIFSITISSSCDKNAVYQNKYKVHVMAFRKNHYIVKLVLRGHLWDKEKMAL